MSDVFFEGINIEEHERTVGASANSPLPQEFYELSVVRASIKQNSPKAKDPQGKYVEVEFDVNSPAEFNRRKYWEKFNIINQNADAVRIGKEHFSDLLKQLGVTSIPAGNLDPSNPFPALMGRAVCAYLTIEKGNNGYADSNKSQKYLPVGSTKADYDAWFASKKPASGGVQASQPRQTWGANAAATPAQAPKQWGNTATPQQAAGDPAQNAVAGHSGVTASAAPWAARK